MTTPTFQQLGVASEIASALQEYGIVRPFAIQELTLPLALDGNDLIGQARTGMGKTLGFGVPLLDRIFDDADIEELDGSPRALVVVPTRELCQQVCSDLTRAAKNLTAFHNGVDDSNGTRPLRVLEIYGGRPYEPQIDALQRGVDVVVGTPGRLLDLHQRGDLMLDKVRVLVLDEADEMLDLGFLPDIEKILQTLPAQRQTMLFSATMPGPIIALSRNFLHKPVHVHAEAAESSLMHSAIKQVVFQSHQMDRIDALSRILQADGRGRTIIFCRTKNYTARVAEDLANRGFDVAAVHGDMGQGAREASLDAFREGKAEILVATDVAARGIDIDDVTHVVNVQVPEDEKTYVHRIGRTGRAGNSGTAVTMVGWDELHRWRLISDALELDNPEPPRWFSNSPELAEALGIPEDAESSVGPARKLIGSRPARSSRQSPRHTSRKPARSARSSRPSRGARRR